MECMKYQNVVTALLDGAAPEADRRTMEQHAAQCPDCALAVSEHGRTRQLLRQMPTVQAPSHLQAHLRVVASRERQRRLARLDFATRVAHWREGLRLTVKNMMQPFALPAAGGILAALLLFALVLPDLPLVARVIDDDVPTTLVTSASVKDTMPLTLASEVVVDLQVDGQGRFVDYAIVRGGPLLHDEAVRRRFENALLFTLFTPATTFGQPTAGKIRVSFRNSVIDVRG
jgi:anti-sigma factor RsiW